MFCYLAKSNYSSVYICISILVYILSVCVQCVIMIGIEMLFILQLYCFKYSVSLCYKHRISLNLFMV